MFLDHHSYFIFKIFLPHNQTLEVFNQTPANEFIEIFKNCHLEFSMMNFVIYFQL